MSDISKTEYFAGCALQGLLAYSHVDPQKGNWQENASSEDIAKRAWELAGHMMQIRRKKLEKYPGGELL